MATFAFTIVMTNTPKKLNTAAIKIAFFAVIERVETHVAMAFGASVQPLTNITPNVRTAVINRGGLDMICERKSEK
jgi:hypothetical protein